MKQIIIIITVLVLLAANIQGYKWENESEFNLYMDFANGGVQENQSGYNTSTVVGGSVTPFNVSTVTYTIHQGLLYIIWSDIEISDVAITVPPSVDCTILHRETEWGEINCTASTSVNWSFSIRDNSTGELYPTFDTRTGGVHKFVGLKESKTYTIEINATASGATNTSTKNLVTKIGGEKNMASLAIMGFVTMITIILFILPWIVKRFSENDILNYSLKGVCIILGLFLLSLDTAIAGTIASNAEIPVTSELFRFLWLINWAAYIAMVVVVLTFGWKVLQLMKWKRQNRQMGYDDG